MDILDVAPNEHLQEMAARLHDGAAEIKLAIDRLELNPDVTSTHTIRARGVKAEIETLYTTALAESFNSPKDLKMVVVLLKLREIYRHLFHAGGRIGDAANTIDDIAVKTF